MKLNSNITIEDLCLIIDEKTVVFGDVHLGFEESLNSKGILIPRSQYKDTHARLKKTLDNIKPDTIIINGDLKHEFGTISETEWRHVRKFITFLKQYTKEIVLIEGNHDTILSPIAREEQLIVQEEYVHKTKDAIKNQEILILHGEKLPTSNLEKINTIIIGHEHPAILLHDPPRSELVKCFLKGMWNKKELIVMPSYNLIKEGVNIVEEKHLSPFLQKDISNFEVLVVSDEILSFGKIKDIEKHE